MYGQTGKLFPNFTLPIDADLARLSLLADLKSNFQNQAPEP